ncbi:unnamed protein product [Heligmosomoides polygyrus]|uniref:Secreted protein n=1 Tax=Heligmosomoides polygyrus TaxID=6339 RepID=A0A183GTE4_HELPZ|nr:unnamed protein product [Heligmosomoides polygyrus]
MRWFAIICVLIAILGSVEAVKNRPSRRVVCKPNDPKYFKKLSKQQYAVFCGRPPKDPRPKKPRIRRLADKFAPLNKLLNKKF